MTAARTWSRHWRLLVLLAWLGACLWFIHDRQYMIRWLVLPDTDDNMRLSQVRALMAGQGWFDLRQYKLNPPVGFDMHWSRLVDLPIALLIRLFGLVLSPFDAERWASAIAPLLPLSLAMASMALVVRRLVAPASVAIALGLMLCGQAAMMMFMPMRIDHHGWQLAFLVLAIAGLVDERPARGGLVMGLASAASLAIGLELIPYLAIAGAAVALRWVWQPEDRQRLERYGLALALGCAAGYAAFASYANRVPRCDVLSPVWMATMVAAGWIGWSLPQLPLRRPVTRLTAGALAGAALAAGFALLAPQCLGRPEQISPELYQSWFQHIREAKPLYTQAWTMAVSIVALPAIGAVGHLWEAWRAWRSPRFAVWAPVALVGLTSLCLLLWQTRMGPAAQLTAVPGATALAWRLMPRLFGHRMMVVRTLGVAFAFMVISGLGVQFAVNVPWPWRQVTPPDARDRAIDRANAECVQIYAYRPVAALPPQTVFTFVDLGPRLITLTHHRAVAGPYHRNGDAILDVHHAFGGTPEEARAIMHRHGATLLMTCPYLNESTVYQARTPDGFYARLARGERFAWLDPLPGPADAPLKLWRVR